MRSIPTVAVSLVLYASVALATERSAHQVKPPTEVRIVSAQPAPAPEPTEVKVLSIPASTAPVEVKVVSTPPDDSTRNLVQATWGLLAVTAALCIATWWVGWRQGRDTRERDRAAMQREVHRNAQSVMLQASRLDEIALTIPYAVNDLNALRRQKGDAPLDKLQLEDGLQQQTKRLKEIQSESLAVVSSPLGKKSLKDLTAHLFRLDSHDVQIQTMRESITDRLSSYEAEIRRLREELLAIDAAMVARGPPKR